MWKFCTFVLQFDNFRGRFEWNDERMHRESSGRRRNDEFIGGPQLIFLIFFVTSCYVLNKICYFKWKLNPRAIWEHPRLGNSAGEPKFIVKPCQNHPKMRKCENRQKQPKTAGFNDFLMFKIHFRAPPRYNDLLRQQKGKVLFMYVNGNSSWPLWFCYVSRQGIIFLYSNMINCKLHLLNK